MPAWVGASLAVIVLYTLYELRGALLLMYAAVVLAILFDPAVEALRRRRIGRYHPSRGAATAMVTALAAAVVFLVAWLVIPPFVSDATKLETQWPQQSAQIFEWIHRHLPFSRSVTPESVSQWVRGIVGHAPVLAIGSTAMDVLSTLLLTIYLLADGPRAFEWMLSLVPRERRPQLATALRRGARRMQGWVAGQGLLMLTHGGSAFLTFWLIGLPYFFALGVFAAVINVIPVLGPILTLGAASLVAAIDSPGTLLGVVIFYLAYHNTEGMYLQPKIMSAAVGIPGVAVVVALLIGDQVAGFIGMVLSVPTAVLLAEVKNAYAGHADVAPVKLASRSHGA